MDDLLTAFLLKFFFNVRVYGYMFGIFVSLCYWKKYPEISRFAFIGFTILLMTLAVFVFVDSAHYTKKVGFLIYFPYGIFHAVFGIIGWSFIVYAVFGKRSGNLENHSAEEGKAVDFLS